MERLPLDVCDFDCIDRNGRCAFMGIKISLVSTITAANNILEMLLTHKSSDAIANAIAQCA